MVMLKFWKKTGVFTAYSDWEYSGKGNRKFATIRTPTLSEEAWKEMMHLVCNEAGIECTDEFERLFLMAKGDQSEEDGFEETDRCVTYHIKEDLIDRCARRNSRVYEKLKETRTVVEKCAENEEALSAIESGLNTAYPDPGFVIRCDCEMSGDTIVVTLEYIGRETDKGFPKKTWKLMTGGEE